MRITGGSLRGRKLAAPSGMATRPSTDRLREALFNILAHGRLAPELSGARVVDLFAGSGALGLEALSRGASFALFIDDAAAARAAIRRNIEALDLAEKTKVWRRDARKPGRCAPFAPFDLAFLDPPYGKGLAEPALAALAAGGWLKPGAWAVVEESARADFSPPPPFTRLESRDYGDTRLHFLRMEV